MKTKCQDSGNPCTWQGGIIRLPRQGKQVATLMLAKTNVATSEVPKYMYKNIKNGQCDPEFQMKEEDRPHTHAIPCAIREMSFHLVN